MRKKILTTEELDSFLSQPNVRHKWINKKLGVHTVTFYTDSLKTEKGILSLPLSTEDWGQATQAQVQGSLSEAANKVFLEARSDHPLCVATRYKQHLQYRDLR